MTEIVVKVYINTQSDHTLIQNLKTEGVYVEFQVIKATITSMFIQKMHFIDEA